MTPTLTFTLDGTNYGNPSGWEGITLNRSFEGRVIGSSLDGELSYGGDAYAYLNALRTVSPCTSALLSCTAECNGATYDLFDFKVRIQDCTFDCDNCRVSFSVSSSSGWDEIADGLADSVCVQTDTSLNLFQVQSGGTLGTGNFVRVYDLLEEIMEAHAGTVSLSSGILNDNTFQPHIIELTLPAVVEDDVLVLTVQSSLGSTYQVTATMPASVTPLQAAELLRNAMLYTEVGATNISMQALELVHRISGVVANPGALVFFSDYELESVSLSLNGSPAGTLTTTQEYQYSLKDLYISSEGLTEESICLSLSDLLEALERLYPIVIEDQGSGIVLDSYETLIPTTGTAGPIENRPVTRTFYDDWLKARLFVGWQFEAQNIQETYDEWRWLGTAETPPDPFAMYAPVGSGPASFSGLIYIQNTGATTADGAIEITIDGAVVASAGTSSIAPGQSFAFDAASMFLNPGDNSFCLDSGNLVMVQIAAGSGAGIVAGSGHTFAIEFGTPCFGSPFIRDWQQYPSSPYNRLQQFEDCGGVLDRTIPGRFEGGMGTAISQQLDGFADYGENHFFVISDDGVNAGKFGRQFYFANQAGVCTCDQDRVVTWNWYNMILQVPHILRNIMQVCPADVGISTYTFTNEVTKGGTYSTSVNRNDLDTFNRTHSRFNKLELTKMLTVEDYLTRIGENVIPVTFCDETITGVIRGLSYSLSSGEGVIELEG